MKTRIPTFLIILSLTCFVSLPKAQALNPPPDGGYPGFNTAEGQNALFSLSTGVGNTAVGWFSLFSNTDGSFNTAVGAGTLLFNIGDQSTNEGISNTAVGTAALLFNTTGSFNSAVGTAALLNNTSGPANTASGFQALLNNTEGEVNNAFGFNALASNDIGSANTAIGFSALFGNTSGVANTAIGNASLASNITGIRNTAVGVESLLASTGNSNTALGYHAGNNVTTASNVICIGSEVLGADVSDACYIGNIFDATAVLGNAVFVSSDNKLGTITSSRRFKQDMRSMDKASEALFSLKPVAFRYKKEIDPAGTPQFGLVAEDVEKVNPDLVVRDKEGKPYSVRYDQVNAMLLNEFLKAHHKVEEQEAKIARFEKDVETLVAHARQQDSQIQRMSAEIEISKAMTTVAGQ
jgi:Chaperone of endosialidase